MIQISFEEVSTGLIIPFVATEVAYIDCSLWRLLDRLALMLAVEDSPGDTSTGRIPTNSFDLKEMSSATCSGKHIVD